MARRIIGENRAAAYVRRRVTPRAHNHNSDIYRRISIRRHWYARRGMSDCGEKCLARTRRRAKMKQRHEIIVDWRKMRSSNSAAM